MTSPLLRVSLIQSELLWQDAPGNRQQLQHIISPLAGNTDLVVLPEMFATGFMMEPEQFAEPEQGPTLDWMRQQAAHLGAAVCGSLAIKSAQGYVNRFYLVDPAGHVQHYDKRHLFRMGEEHHHYQAGEQRVILVWRGWRILPQVCYDLRFPVFMRNRNDYDLAICVANWPAPRRQPWRILLQARALENQCYLVGVNRVGEDGNGLPYSGDSLAVDFKGECLIDHPPGQAFVQTCSLSFTELQQFRERFPAWQDADAFTLS